MGTYLDIVALRSSGSARRSKRAGVVESHASREGDPHVWLQAFIVASALFTACGAWWLASFNSRTARWYFNAHPTRSLPASLVAVYLFLDAIYNSANGLWVPRAQVFGWKFKDASASFVYASVVALELAGAAVVWWKRERARQLIVGFLALYAAQGVWMLIAEWTRLRWDYRAMNSAGALLGIVAMMLATRRWTPSATVYPMESAERHSVDLPDFEAPPAAGIVTPRELVRFSYFHLNRRDWPITLLALIAVPLFIMVILLDPQSFSFPLVQNLLPFVFLLLLWLLIPWWGAWRQYRKLQHLRERVTYRLNEFGAQAEGENYRGEIAWKLIHAIRETKTMFLVYHTPQVAWVIPKRFFASDLGAEAFRAYSEKHLASPRRYYGPGLIGSWL